MKVFLSYARKDVVLALKLAAHLKTAGFSVWIADEHFARGENWAKQIGKALDAAELIVFLLTPRSLDSDVVRQDVEFAITSRKLEGCVFTVFVGSKVEADQDVPWILLKLPHRRIRSAKEFAEVANDIQSQWLVQV